MKTGSYMTTLGVILVLSESAVSGRGIKASQPKCCDDLDHHGFETNGDKDGCAAVKIGSRCKTAMSWLESKETCENLGARLCYFDEVESQVLKGLGCSSSDEDDNALTWTDERCVYDFDSGGDGYLAFNEDGDEQYCLSKAHGKAQLACCADPCTSSSSSSSSQAQAFRSIEAKSCSDLKMDFPFQHIGDHTVCATISVENDDSEWVCGGDEPWESAQSKCEAIGARLCTGDETLKAIDLVNDHDSGDVSLGSGCDLEDALVWTSERCVSDWETGEYGYLAAGAMDIDDDYLVCLPGGKARTACCADSETESSAMSDSSATESSHRDSSQRGSKFIEDDSD